MAGRQSPRKKNDPVSLSTASCQDDEIEPISGEHFFHVMFLKSHVSSLYHLAIPAKFTHHLPRDTVPVILACGDREWESSYPGNHSTHKRLDPQTWKAFVIDNQLKIGDICVFELMEPPEQIIKFKVQILRGEFPSVLLERMEGTKDKPMVID